MLGRLGVDAFVVCRVCWEIVPCQCESFRRPRGKTARDYQGIYNASSKHYRIWDGPLQGSYHREGEARSEHYRR